MEAIEPFRVMDCSLVRLATGQMCSNLRELLDAVRTVHETVLEHHMMRCALEDHFELHEFPNDLARWCWTALGDNVLGEQLGLIAALRAVDFYFLNLSQLREALRAAFRHYLAGAPPVPRTPP